MVSIFVKPAIVPKRDPLNHADRQVIASVLAWDMQRQVAPEEIITEEGAIYQAA